MPDTPAPLVDIISRWRAAGSDSAGHDPETLSRCAAELEGALTAAPVIAAPQYDQVKVAGVITTAFGDFYAISYAAPLIYVATPAKSLSGGAYDKPTPIDFNHADHAHRMITEPMLITVRRAERRLA